MINTPVLGAAEKDTANTCSIVHNDHVIQYWDPNLGNWERCLRKR